MLSGFSQACIQANLVKGFQIRLIAASQCQLAEQSCVISPTRERNPRPMWSWPVSEAGQKVTKCASYWFFNVPGYLRAPFLVASGGLGLKIAKRNDKKIARQCKKREKEIVQPMGKVKCFQGSMKRDAIDRETILCDFLHRSVNKSRWSRRKKSYDPKESWNMQVHAIVNNLADWWMITEGHLHYPGQRFYSFQYLSHPQVKQIGMCHGNW